MSKHNQGKIGDKGGYLQEKPTFKAKTEGLEDSIFYYGKGMKENYLKVSREISEYIGTKYGMDVKLTMPN